MKQSINFSQFCDSFSDTYKDNFSHEGKRALFDYLEDYEQGSEEEMELDPVALCCEYAEYGSVIEAAEEYFTYESAPEGTLEENEKLALKFLEDNTTVIEVGNTGRVIIEQF